MVQSQKKGNERTAQTTSGSSRSTADSRKRRHICRKRGIAITSCSRSERWASRDVGRRNNDDDKSKQMVGVHLGEAEFTLFKEYVSIPSRGLELNCVAVPLEHIARYNAAFEDKAYGERQDPAALPSKERRRRRMSPKASFGRGDGDFAVSKVARPSPSHRAQLQRGLPTRRNRHKQNILRRISHHRRLDVAECRPIGAGGEISQTQWRQQRRSPLGRDLPAGPLLAEDSPQIL